MMIKCNKRAEAKLIRIIKKKKSKWLEQRLMGGSYFSHVFREDSQNIRKGCLVLWEKGNSVRQNNTKALKPE